MPKPNDKLTPGEWIWLLIMWAPVMIGAYLYIFKHGWWR